MCSTTPAEIANLANEVGALCVGRRGDMLLMGQHAAKVPWNDPRLWGTEEASADGDCQGDRSSRTSSSSNSAWDLGKTIVGGRVVWDANMPLVVVVDP